MRTPLLATLVVTCTVLAGCSADPVAPEPTPTPTVTASADPSPSETAAQGPAAPLTGIASSDPDVARRPVLAVKIENTAPARPQSGLEQADVVFEELVEGGLTRFIALFQSQVPDAIGPIRSARLVDVELLPSYGSVLAISGARDQVLRDLARAGVPFMADGKGFHRASGRRAPHNLFATGASLFERADGLGGTTPPPRPWTFSSTPPEGSVDCGGDVACRTAVEDVSFPMSSQSRTGWTWDADAGVYRRWQDRKPFLTSSLDVVGATNVVILAMTVGDGECCDTNGSPLVHTAVIGSGRAVFLRDGRWYEGTWRKTSRTQDLELLGEDGGQFVLRPGSTWVHLTPAGNVPATPEAGSSTEQPTQLRGN